MEASVKENPWLEETLLEVVLASILSYVFLNVQLACTGAQKSEKP